MNNRPVKFFVTALLMLLSVDSTIACTRLLKVDNNNATMVGRNMDWVDDLRTNLVIYPRGQTRTGAVSDNPVKWVSRYGSVVTTAYEQFTSDGLNEQGLAGHVLWLNAADFGQRNPAQQGLSVALWIQYYLDNFSTVNEAMRFTQTNPFQLVALYHPETKKWMNVHLVLDDASGDSAILEYTKGQLHIYHDKHYAIAANDPTFDEQLSNLANYKSFGGELPLPGSNRSPDRFVRASFYTQNFPPATSTNDELAQILSALNNVAQPYSVPSSENPFDFKTVWHVVADLTNKVYYFQSTATQNLLKIKLDSINFNAGTPIKMLDLVNHPELAGDVADKFEVPAKTGAVAMKVTPAK